MKWIVCVCVFLTCLNVCNAGFCEGLADGVYGDPDNCWKFIVCQDQMISDRMKCPYNMAWGETTRSCRTNWIVKCTDQ